MLPVHEGLIEGAPLGLPYSFKQVAFNYVAAHQPANYIAVKPVNEDT